MFRKECKARKFYSYDLPSSQLSVLDIFVSHYCAIKYAIHLSRLSVSKIYWKVTKLEKNIPPSNLLPGRPFKSILEKPSRFSFFMQARGDVKISHRYMMKIVLFKMWFYKMIIVSASVSYLQIHDTY